MEKLVNAKSKTPVAEPATIPRRSIVLKLTLFVGILVALTAGTLITVGYLYTSMMLSDQIDARLSAAAEDRQGLLRSRLAHLDERVRLIADRPQFRALLDRHARGVITPEAFGAGAARIFDDVRTGWTEFMAIWIETDSGKVVASSGDESLVAMFAVPQAPRDPVAADSSMVELPRAIGDAHAALFATEARARSGRRIGRLLLLIDLGHIMTDLSDPQWLGDTGEVVVGARVNDQTRFVFPPRLDPANVEFPPSRTPAMNQALDGKSGFMRAVDRRGREILAAYRPVGYAGWGLSAQMDVQEAYAPVNRLRGLLLAIGGLILAAGLGASYLIARQNTRPIRRLAATADTIARGNLEARIDITSNDEIGVLGQAFTRMTERLARSHADLENRIAERTRDLETTRDLLDAFFRIFTSRLETENIHRTFDTVLRFCHQLGYDVAMISLVDREAGVIRAVRGAGTMTEVVDLTVRSLTGDDILAVVARQGKPVVIADSAVDPRCDQGAVALSKIHGQIIMPLIGDEVLGTLQVATPEILDPSHVDLRPLETLASHTARALDGLKQVEEIHRLTQSLEQHACELIKSEAAVRQKTRILQSVLDCMREGVVVVDREARLLVFNPAAEQILGRAPAAAPQQPWNPLHAIYHPDRVTRYTDDELPLFRAIRGESLDQVEVFVAHPSLQHGSWMVINARPLRDDQGEVQGGLVVFHDLTRRKNNERRQAAQYATTRVLAEVDTLNEANPRILEIIGQHLDWDFGSIWRIDQGNHQLRCVTQWRGAEIAIPRFEESTRTITFASGVGLPGRVWATRKAAWVFDLATDSNFPRSIEASQEGLHSGFAAPILVRGECLGVLEFFSREPRQQDDALLQMMTSVGSQIGQFIERHQMHSRMVQSEKLASLGMLSAGVAHEINNPLAYVANNLAVLERDVHSLLCLIKLYEGTKDSLAGTCPETLAEIHRQCEACDLPYIQENLDKILASTRQGVKRVAEIVHNLRGFARLDRAAVDQVDVHEALGTALEMVRGRLQRRHITVVERKGELPPVSASPVQVNQVFLNLLVNAMQAIEATHREDGQITIETRCAGSDVVIEIADDGCGIPPEVLPQIFDPFFTTKSVGDGTGLGLSITHGIVQDHAGRMEVESTLGQGTCFRVILPVSRK